MRPSRRSDPRIRVARRLTLHLVALLGAGAEAGAQPLPAAPPGAGDVEGHLDRALALFNARNYAEAAHEFRRAYEKKPSGDYLYAWAQSERLSGNCANAMPLYEQYLTREPGGANAEVARINLARCKTQASTGPTAGGETGLRQPNAPPAPIPRDPWYRDVVGAMLAGASVAAFGAAVGFKISADRSFALQDEARSYDVFDGRAKAVERWDSLATASLVAGTALLITSAARYLWKVSR
jgi:tetratricopeptide (TPR) repeat protein